MLRKIFSVILVLTMICSLSIAANAHETSESEEIIAESIVENSDNEIMPYGLSVPSITSEWDLDGNPYPVTLTSVGSNNLYTDKVFRPDSDLSISITVKVSAKKNTTVFTVGIYDVTAGRVHDSDVITISSLSTTSQTKTATVDGLNPTHVYAFYFTSNGAVATGSASVFHK